MKRCALSTAIIVVAVGLIMTGNVYSLSAPWDSRVHGDDHPWGGDQINEGGTTQRSADPPDYFVTGYTAIDLFFNEYWIRSFKARYFRDYKTSFVRVRVVEEKKPADDPIMQPTNTNGNKGN